MHKSILSFYKIYESNHNRLYDYATKKSLLNNFKQNYLIPNIKKFSDVANILKVTVVGGMGKIGQPLCLMLKQSPLIDDLCIHDMVPTSGFISELNHIDTNCKVTGYTGAENIELALKDSNIVVILAAAAEADFLPFEKMWSPNADIVRKIVYHCGKNCPKAFVAIGTNPVNSIVPLACEVMKKAGIYNPKTVFGITTLDSVRANTFVAQVQGIEPECVTVPVIGGSSEETIIPILSQAKPCNEFTNEELENLTTNIRRAQTNMLKLKHPDTASLSSSFATCRFVISLVKAIRGFLDIVETAYVPSKVHPQLKYLSTPLMLGPSGIKKNLGLPTMTQFEACMLDNAIPTLVADVKRGESFVGIVEPPVCEPSNPNAPRCPANWCDALKERSL